uniref:Protein kinase domain-containing protein n=1 Tax=Echinostoma caproni TaxID=27848 RepID=A0A183B341_9TREM
LCTVQTDAIPISSVSYAPHGPGSVKVRWSVPADPNGVILYYQIRYRPVQFSKEDFLSISPVPDLNQTVTVTQSVESSHTHGLFGEVVLSDLAEGVYAMQLRAISLARSSSWNDGDTFFIIVPSHSGAAEHLWAGQQPWIFLVGAFLTLFLVLIGFVVMVYYARQRYLRATAWTSTNPDYWTIYEVDNWEMERTDIDLLDWNYPLGHGSFGTVYRGVVRLLRTPASAFYPDPTNILVAVKTINTATTLFDRLDFINEACHMKQFQTYHLVRFLGLVSRPDRTNHRSGILQQRLRTFFSNLCHGRRRTGPVNADCARTRTRSKWIIGLNRDYSCLGLMTDMRWSSQSANGTSPTHSSATQVNKSSHHPALNAALFDVAPNSPLVVMELMSEGDLASYLRHLGDRGLGSVEPSQAYLWATQIADGMAYLAAKHYVHRCVCMHHFRRSVTFA